MVQTTAHYMSTVAKLKKITMGAETGNDQDYQFIKVDRCLARI